MWSGIEACASVICANLPCYGPLLSKTKGLKLSLGSLQSRISLRGRVRNHSLSASKRPKRSKSSSRENIIAAQYGVENNIEGIGPRQVSESELETGRIKVQIMIGGDSGVATTCRYDKGQCTCLAEVSLPEQSPDVSLGFGWLEMPSL